MTEESGAILVVDDDADMREMVHDMLKDRRHQVTTASSGQEALRLLGEGDYAVVLSDLRMKGMQGIELLTEIKKTVPDINVILMTAFGSVETAVEAMKYGASDYLTKPVKKDELIRVVERVLREAGLRREVSRLRKEVHKEYSFHHILGKSKPMQAVFDLIKRVADSPTNILITGESGTGKELVAKAIHYNSDRKEAPLSQSIVRRFPSSSWKANSSDTCGDRSPTPGWTSVVCSRRRKRGALFLDEISELPIMLQAKLLRAIQEKEIRRVGATKPISVDVRIIAATNLNLAEEAKAKRFRDDLYYRLNVIELKLPPLRDRREDIVLLVEGFLKRCGEVRGKEVKGVSEASLAMLMDYTWPGNVRELENVIERAVTLSRGEKVTPDDLPPAVQGARGDRRVLDEAVEKTLPLHEIEKEYIKKILDKTGGNKYQAAQALGIDRKTLYRKLAEIEGKPQPED